MVTRFFQGLSVKRYNRNCAINKNIEGLVWCKVLPRLLYLVGLGAFNLNSPVTSATVTSATITSAGRSLQSIWQLNLSQSPSIAKCCYFYFAYCYNLTEWRLELVRYHRVSSPWWALRLIGSQLAVIRPKSGNLFGYIDFHSVYQYTIYCLF